MRKWSSFGSVPIGAILLLAQFALLDALGDEGKQWQLQHARKLNEKLTALAAARTEAEANRLASQVWSLWLQSGRDDVDALMWQARRALRQGQYQHAIGILDQALRLSPRYSEAWNLRATVLFYMGKDEESAADIERTLALEPRHFGALSGLMMIHMRAKNWAAALRSLRAALKVHPYLHDDTVKARLKALAEEPDL